MTATGGNTPPSTRSATAHHSRPRGTVPDHDKHPNQLRPIPLSSITHRNGRRRLGDGASYTTQDMADGRPNSSPSARQRRGACPARARGLLRTRPRPPRRQPRPQASPPPRPCLGKRRGRGRGKEELDRQRRVGRRSSLRNLHLALRRASLSCWLAGHSPHKRRRNPKPKGRGRRRERTTTTGSAARGRLLIARYGIARESAFLE